LAVGIKNLLKNLSGMSKKSILVVAVDPSYFNFFLEALQEGLFWRLRLHWIVTGCITILQAVRF